MNKIMFNDRYGLTQAVLDGRKTMTRRLWTERAHYHCSEVVAIAQSYRDAGYSKTWVMENITPNPKALPTDPFEKQYPGWNNKMYVKAEHMHHHIDILDIRIERLQNISTEDCMREGIIHLPGHGYTYSNGTHFGSPLWAFRNLIDSVSGRGTWIKNQWMYVYVFELLD